MAIKDPENTLIIETSKGRVVVAMRPDLAPGHVAHIKKLAREGFYDGIIFHRVIEGFMAQTGCPKGTGTGQTFNRSCSGKLIYKCRSCAQSTPTSISCIAINHDIQTIVRL